MNAPGTPGGVCRAGSWGRNESSFWTSTSRLRVNCEFKVGRVVTCSHLHLAQIPVIKRPRVLPIVTITAF